MKDAYPLPGNGIVRNSRRSATWDWQVIIACLYTSPYSRNDIIRNNCVSIILDQNTKTRTCTDVIDLIVGNRMTTCGRSPFSITRVQLNTRISEILDDIVGDHRSAN